jgi:hypothetical protein
VEEGVAEKQERDYGTKTRRQVGVSKVCYMGDFVMDAETSEFTTKR